MGSRSERLRSRATIESQRTHFSSKGTPSRVSPALRTCVLWLMIGPGPGGAQSSAPERAADTCPVSPAAKLSITGDSIGPLGIQAPLVDLLRRCPAARIDTTLVKTYDVNPQAEPRVVFPFDGLQVSAIAAGRASAIDSGRPLHLWILRGAAGRLPRGLPSDATWSQLTATYGNRGIVWVENGQVQVGFCAARGVVFLFGSADYAQRDLLEAHKFQGLKLQALQDPILPNARIRAITFGSKEVPCR